MTIFEGLALAAWKKMWSLYDQRYGTFGEARVAALQRDIEKMQKALDEAKKRIDSLGFDVTEARHDRDFHSSRADAAESRANGLAARVNELEAKANAVGVSETPYAVPPDGATMPDPEVGP